MTYEHNENINKVRVVILKINYGTKITIANNFLERFKKQTKSGTKNNQLTQTDYLKLLSLKNKTKRGVKRTKNAEKRTEFKKLMGYCKEE